MVSLWDENPNQLLITQWMWTYIYWILDLENEVHSIWVIWTSGLQECKGHAMLGGLGQVRMKIQKLWHSKLQLIMENAEHVSPCILWLSKLEDLKTRGILMPWILQCTTKPSSRTRCIKLVTPKFLGKRSKSTEVCIALA